MSESFVSAVKAMPKGVDPLRKVPPASRGNRVGARLGSPREAGRADLCSARFPSRSGGNLQEGGSYNHACKACGVATPRPFFHTQPAGIDDSTANHDTGGALCGR